MTAAFPSDIAFTDTVKTLQSRKGSRRAYANMENGRGWQTTITPELKVFIEEQISVFLGTANAAGQPYIQHRGGPPGFLRVLDDTTLGFVDYSGNRQYISSGNLLENPKAHLFLIDYAHRRRVKMWGTARFIADDAALVERLMPDGYDARPEQVLLFELHAWDANCPQHIPQRLGIDDVARLLTERDARIAALEAELFALREGNLSRRE